MEYIVIDGGCKKVSKEVAAEIIRRTDSFYEELYNGNNHEFNRLLYKLSGVKADYQAIENANSCCDMDYRYILGGKDVFDNILVYDKWKIEEWGCLGLQYFLNNWISCCSVSGPHGWISPEGDIGGLLYGDKYGIIEEDLEDDLKKIASEWPFLEFSVYLVDYPGEGEPIWVSVEWKIKGGNVEKVREDYETDNLDYSHMDPEVYKKHLKEAENPECWWSLEELKVLWPGKLISGGNPEEG